MVCYFLSNKITNLQLFWFVDRVTGPWPIVVNCDERCSRRVVVDTCM